ncbi:MAG: Gx transporter family protein [Clostridia bacterium]|nr:Gx transporter family protein [Clostridia bacterium]
MTKKLTFIALYTAVATIMHYLEGLLPSFFPFAPGVKLGLANIVGLIALFTLDKPSAYIIVTARCVLGALFGGNLFSLAYSLTGALVSLTGQIVALKFLFPKVTVVGISVIGAMLHNLTQLTVASIVVWTNLLSYLPLMMLTGVLTGIVVGLITRFTVLALPSSLYLTERKTDEKSN